MALYQCSEPGCQGHDTFSARCPRVITDYPPLTRFLMMLGSAEIRTPVPESPVINSKPARTRIPESPVMSSKPARKVVDSPTTVETVEAPVAEASTGGKSSNGSKDYITFWRE